MDVHNFCPSSVIITLSLQAMKAAEKEVEEGSLGESLDDVLDDATKASTYL